MADRFDVAVLGTGIFGSALVHDLLRAPALRVIAFGTEGRALRRDATAASAGILSLQGWDPWDLALVRESAEEYRLLAEEEGIEPVRTDGGVRVARTEEGSRWLERVRRVLEREGAGARWLGPGERRELWPFADLEGVRSALFTPEDATVSPEELRDAYRRRAARAGAEIRPLPEPFALAPIPGHGWRIGEEPAAVADALVVAAGAHSKRILAELGFHLPLAPFRAQAARWRPRPLLAPFPTLHDLDLDLYLRPAPFGELLVGDGTGRTEEDPDRWEENAEAAFLEGMRAALGELLPGRPVHLDLGWAGLCVASPDRYPLVGRVPGAERLYLGSGFNGLGTMRAAALARRLAEAIRSDRWEALAPADPARFPPRPGPFAPRPEFPLEGPESEEGPPRGPESPPAALSTPADGIRYRPLFDPRAVDGLRWAPLSEWFDPFLPLFAKDALRTGGTVEVAEVEDGRLRGLALTGSSEGVGSVFTRTRAIAQRYLDRREPAGIYLEAPGGSGAEPVELFAASLPEWAPEERLRHPVRIARPDDLPRLRGLMRGELGPGVDPWIATLPRPEETAFLCEVDGRPVGVSWLTRVGVFARGHSFLVAPRYRGLGIGTDLLLARMLWLKRTGARRVVSEIYDGNAASRAAAERAGMALVGRMYHLRPPARADGPVRSGARRSSGSS